MPSVIANELVGVQPMSGPVGQIHTLRVRYAQAASGVNPGDEALSKIANHIRETIRCYSGFRRNCG